VARVLRAWERRERRQVSTAQKGKNEEKGRAATAAPHRSSAASDGPARASIRNEARRGGAAQAALFGFALTHSHRTENSQSNRRTRSQNKRRDAPRIARRQAPQTCAGPGARAGPAAQVPGYRTQWHVDALQRGLVTLLERPLGARDAVAVVLIVGLAACGQHSQ